jgi:hypothetical protein
MDQYKKQSMTSTLKFFQQYNNEEAKFVDHILTDDETWISFSNAEIKKKFMVWEHTEKIQPFPILWQTSSDIMIFLFPTLFLV